MWWERFIIAAAGCHHNSFLTSFHIIPALLDIFSMSFLNILCSVSNSLFFIHIFPDHFSHYLTADKTNLSSEATPSNLPNDEVSDSYAVGSRPSIPLCYWIFLGLLHGAHPTAYQASFHSAVIAILCWSKPSHSQNPTDHIWLLCCYAHHFRYRFVSCFILSFVSFLLSTFSLIHPLFLFSIGMIQLPGPSYKNETI